MTIKRAKQLRALTIEQLDEQINLLTRRADRMDGIVSAPLGHEAYFHLGTVGGSGKPVRRLNQRRERLLEGVIKAVGESISLRRQIAGLQAQRHRLTPDGIAETGEIEAKTQVLSAQVRERQAVEHEILRSSKPGTIVKHFAYGQVEVVRSHRLSLTIRTSTGQTHSARLDEFDVDRAQLQATE